MTPNDERQTRESLLPRADNAVHNTDGQTEALLEDKKRHNASGLSWDETIPKPGENFNRATEMGEAD